MFSFFFTSQNTAHRFPFTLIGKQVARSDGSSDLAGELPQHKAHQFADVRHVQTPPRVQPETGDIAGRNSNLEEITRNPLQSFLDLKGVRKKKTGDSVFFKPKRLFVGRL